MNDESESSAGRDPEKQVPLPELFYSEETREPFDRCIECGVCLVGDSKSAEEGGPCYQISKRFVRKEAVFEFAMCMDCVGKLQVEFSKQTRQAIQSFLMDKLMASQSVPAMGLERCMVCQQSREECYEYSLGGLCVGRQLMLNMGPFVMCNECEAAMNDLISEETRDRWDRFVDENFDSPPWANADSPSTVPILI